MKKVKFNKLPRLAQYKIAASKKKKQTFVIADNGKKVKCGTSLAEKKWLDRLHVPVRSKVVILFGKTYVLDGYDPKTMTAYEYNGEAYHGSHKVYPINRDNKTWLGKTPNELYYGTIQRYNLLMQMGIKVFFVWESDYKRGYLGRYYRGSGDNLY